MSPGAAILAAWLVWLVSWILAAGWSARTAARAELGVESPTRVITFIGIVTMGFGWSPFSAPLWQTDETTGWICFALVLGGFAFAWWARVHLGNLWSGWVARKEGHRIIDTGPYAVVRHPIYSGILFSAFATALERARIECLAGALILLIGLSIRSKIEERFLSSELGAESYAAYRARVPMLIPFIKR